MLQARFDWACSWMVLVSANYRPPPSTGLSRIQHLDDFWNLTYSQMYSYGGCQGIFKCGISAVPWQAAYGSEIKECVYAKRENNGRN